MSVGSPCAAESASYPEGERSFIFSGVKTLSYPSVSEKNHPADGVVTVADGVPRRLFFALICALSDEIIESMLSPDETVAYRSLISQSSSDLMPSAPPMSLSRTSRFILVMMSYIRRSVFDASFALCPATE